MNMLNTEMRALVQFSESEIKQFFDLNRNDVQVLNTNGEWIDRQYPTMEMGEIYRLKLKEGEWYTLVCETLGETTQQCDGKWNESCIKSIRPAAQSEINSVKPEFKRGDVVAFEHPNHNGLMRLDDFDYIDDNQAGYFSMTGSSSGIVFDSLGVNFDSFIKATPAQIKQLELEEMKHGKKWNGEGYDDLLTQDGLTFNELIKHHLSEIEFKNGGVYESVPNDNALDKDWIIKNAFSFGQVATTIDKFRLKPEESFVDYEIDWDKNKIFHKSFSHNLGATFIKNQDGSFWLSGYIFSGYPHACVDDKMKFKDHKRKEILSKATHARLVKVGE